MRRGFVFLSIALFSVMLIAAAAVPPSHSVPLVILTPDPCKCTATEIPSVVVAGGSCTTQGGATVKCFSYTFQPLNPANFQHGRCTHTPQCPETAKQCQYEGMDIRITAASCAATCLGDDATGQVFLDSVLLGSIVAGSTFLTETSPDDKGVTVSPGPKSCGASSTTYLIEVKSEGQVVFSLVVVVSCPECSAASGT